MIAISIAAKQAELLERMANTVYMLTVASKTNSVLTPELEAAEEILKEIDELDKLKKGAIVTELWQGIKVLKEEPENDWERNHGLRIFMIPGVKAYRLIYGTDLKTSVEAVKAIREEIHNGTIKFPNLD
jgi:hypothetical protein